MAGGWIGTITSLLPWGEGRYDHQPSPLGRGCLAPALSSAGARRVRGSFQSAAPIWTLRIFFRFWLPYPRLARPGPGDLTRSASFARAHRDRAFILHPLLFPHAAGRQSGPSALPPTTTCKLAALRLNYEGKSQEAWLYFSTRGRLSPRAKCRNTRPAIRSSPFLCKHSRKTLLIIMASLPRNWQRPPGQPHRRMNGVKSGSWLFGTSTASCLWKQRYSRGMTRTPFTICGWPAGAYSKCWT